MVGSYSINSGMLFMQMSDVTFSGYLISPQGNDLCTEMLYKLVEFLCRFFKMKSLKVYILGGSALSFAEGVTNKTGYGYRLRNRANISHWSWWQTY